MYLRFGWVAGNVGLTGSLIIVTLSTGITFLTALSIAAITTDRCVRIKMIVDDDQAAVSARENLEEIIDEIRIETEPVVIPFEDREIGEIIRRSFVSADFVIIPNNNISNLSLKLDNSQGVTLSQTFFPDEHCLLHLV